MKRTLLAIGVAVIASLMWVPFGQYYADDTERVTAHAPFFAQAEGGILYKPLFLQTLFAAVLAAIIVNLFRRKK
jgi:hypothetical protein